MAAVPARDLLIYALVDSTTYMKFLGLRTVTLDFGSQSVDVTSSTSEGRWQELLQGAGVNSMTLKGQGVFTDDQSYISAFNAFIAGLARPYRVLIPKFATIDGMFQITALSMQGSYNGELTSDITFSSSAMPTIQMGDPQPI